MPQLVKQIPEPRSLESNILEYWTISRDLLEANRYPGSKSILAPQFKLRHLQDSPIISDRLYSTIQKTQDLAKLLKEDHIREARCPTATTLTREKNPEDFPRQVRQDAGTSAAPSEAPQSGNSREIYKRGDEIIIGMKDKTGKTVDWRGFLGEQNMMTGAWYVMTPDWAGYASEKSFQHAPKPSKGDVV